MFFPKHPCAVLPCLTPPCGGVSSRMELTKICQGWACSAPPTTGAQCALTPPVTAEESVKFWLCPS